MCVFFINISRTIMMDNSASFHLLLTKLHRWKGVLDMRDTLLTLERLADSVILRIRRYDTV